MEVYLLYFNVYISIDKWINCCCCLHTFHNKQRYLQEYIYIYIYVYVYMSIYIGLYNDSCSYWNSIINASRAHHEHHAELLKLIIPAFATRMMLMVRSTLAAYFLGQQKEGQLEPGAPLIVLCQDQHMCNIYIYICISYHIVKFASYPSRPALKRIYRCVYRLYIYIYISI